MVINSPVAFLLAGIGVVLLIGGIGFIIGYAAGQVDAEKESFDR